VKSLGKVWEVPVEEICSQFFSSEWKDDWKDDERCWIFLKICEKT
jgi:hypothetical protein